MSISPMAGLGFQPIVPIRVPGTDGTSLLDAAGGATGAAGSANFGQLLGNALGGLQKMQSTTDHMAVGAATGTLTDPSQYLVAATESSLATQMTVAFRDKAINAFNEIMRMPL